MAVRLDEKIDASSTNLRTKWAAAFGGECTKLTYTNGANVIAAVVVPMFAHICNLGFMEDAADIHKNFEGFRPENLGMDPVSIMALIATALDSIKVLQKHELLVKIFRPLHLWIVANKEIYTPLNKIIVKLFGTIAQPKKMPKCLKNRLYTPVKNFLGIKDINAVASRVEEKKTELERRCGNVCGILGATLFVTAIITIVCATVSLLAQTAICLAILSTGGYAAAGVSMSIAFCAGVSSIIGSCITFIQLAGITISFCKILANMEKIKRIKDLMQKIDAGDGVTYRNIIEVFGAEDAAKIVKHAVDLKWPEQFSAG